MLLYNGKGNMLCTCAKYPDWLVLEAHYAALHHRYYQVDSVYCCI